MQRKGKLDEISKEVHQGVQAGCGTTIARGRSGGLGGAQSGTDPIVPLFTSRRPLAQSVLGGSGTSRCSPSFLARPDASATGLSLFFPRPDLRPPFPLSCGNPLAPCSRDSSFFFEMLQVQIWSRGGRLSRRRSGQLSRGAVRFLVARVPSEVG